MAEQLRRPSQLPLLLCSPLQHSAALQRSVWPQPIPLHPELHSPQLDTAVAAKTLWGACQHERSKGGMAPQCSPDSNPSWLAGRPFDVPFGTALEGNEHL